MHLQKLRAPLRSAVLAPRRSVLRIGRAEAAHSGQSVRASRRTVMTWLPVRPTAVTATDRRVRRGSARDRRRTDHRLRAQLREPSQRQNDARRRPLVWDRRRVRLLWFEEGGGETCAELLSTVPHWFGKAQANEEYRRVADRCPTLVAMDNGQAVGFLTVVRHSPRARVVPHAPSQWSMSCTMRSIRRAALCSWWAFSAK
jgi:hypothetical protein